MCLEGNKQLGLVEMNVRACVCTHACVCKGLGTRSGVTGDRRPHVEQGENGTWARFSGQTNNLGDGQRMCRERKNPRTS